MLQPVRLRHYILVHSSILLVFAKKARCDHMRDDTGARGSAGEEASIVVRQASSGIFSLTQQTDPARRTAKTASVPEKIQHSHRMAHLFAPPSTHVTILAWPADLFVDFSSSSQPFLAHTDIAPYLSEVHVDVVNGENSRHLLCDGSVQLRRRGRRTSSRWTDALHHVVPESGRHLRKLAPRRQ